MMGKVPTLKRLLIGRARSLRVFSEDAKDRLGGVEKTVSTPRPSLHNPHRATRMQHPRTMPATVKPRSLRAARCVPGWTPLFAFLAWFVLGSLFAWFSPCHAASSNPMDHDDPADTIASFSESMMRDAMWDMYDADTGAMLNNSKAEVVNVDTEDPDDLDVALFVDADDMGGTMEPNTTQIVQMCEFMFPENCEKETPYVWAPETYDCGESDEANADTGFVCSNITANTDKDGDLAVIAETRAPGAMCMPENPEDAAIETDVEAAQEDPSPTDRRRKLSQARQRRRSGNRSRHIRAGRARGTRSSTRGRRG